MNFAQNAEMNRGSKRYDGKIFIGVTEYLRSKLIERLGIEAMDDD